MSHEFDVLVGTSNGLKIIHNIFATYIRRTKKLYTSDKLTSLRLHVFVLVHSNMITYNSPLQI